MKHIHFDTATNGFNGAYWPCEGADCAVIAMIGDDPEDRLARSAAKWLGGQGINVLTMSPGKSVCAGRWQNGKERSKNATEWNAHSPAAFLVRPS